MGRESGIILSSLLGIVLGKVIMAAQWFHLGEHVFRSDARRSVGTVPITESDFGAIRSPLEVSLSRQRWKKWYFGLFAPLWSAPGPPILAQIGIFLAQNLGTHVGAHPLFELG